MKPMLQNIHAELFDSSNHMTVTGGLPIKVSRSSQPVIATDRWHIVPNGHMVKKYQFRRPEDKSSFVIGLLEYENKVQHHAMIIIDEDTVILRLITHDIDQVTEIDKEYGKFSDLLFKDLVYSK